MDDKEKLISQFKQRNIVVVGDLMLDKYIFGKVERISPEAPIPVVQVNNERYALGGAANVSANIASLNAHPYLLGVLGKDLSQTIFMKKCEKRNIDTSGIICDEAKHTIQKIRVIGQHQQLLRIDYESGNYLEEKSSQNFLAVLNSLPKVDAVIVSDYAKGTISADLLKNLKKFADEKKVLLIIDPKPKHRKWYDNVSLITPNLKEAQELSNIQVNSQKTLENCGRKLNELFNCDIIITTGEKGMSIFPKNGKISHIATKATEVYDVSGAGDTVVAVLTLALASGANLAQAAELANIAAGIKVRKLGTAPVSWQELLGS